jgi:hypothetical protein
MHFAYIETRPVYEMCSLFDSRAYYENEVQVYIQGSKNSRREICDRVSVTNLNNSYCLVNHVVKYF